MKDLPTYRANPQHHRASLLTNMKYWRAYLIEETDFSGWLIRSPRLQHTEQRIRRDLESLNGMAGVW